MTESVYFSIDNAAVPPVLWAIELLAAVLPALLVIDFYGVGSLALSVIDLNAAGYPGP
jgi:hypothetical protein